MAFLEKNMGWLTAIIAIAPMMGFTGTVAGMIFAFDAIAAANDISPAVVAVGISQALLNYGVWTNCCNDHSNLLKIVFSSMIDGMVLDMEERSIEITDLLRDSK